VRNVIALVNVPLDGLAVTLDEPLNWTKEGS
jgi:hypothetical protein